MKGKQALLLLSAGLLASALTACGNNNTGTAEQEHAGHTAQASQAAHAGHTMAAQPTPGTGSTETARPVQTAGAAAATDSPAAEAIRGELDGLSAIEKEANRGDFAAAAAAFEGLHEGFHAILAIVKDRLGAAYSEGMHPDFDALEAAIHGQDKAKTLNLVQANRDALSKAAADMGIALNP
ncbi:hypothetical protein KIH86_17995 [Paenibacillus sp. HN-1]|uniref:hypothetical protein n=1 Tax=Paenibacillus TaxID=44249 RepID=UPI001CA93E55|nr:MULTISPECIES: hypothetical protein [Paenibacillus]MBY9078238.1 hypothetical protein [Paenibacillus sp. CGMCC 1.18879]MBY9086103.1 hypothetical protein [Paenibacillus sinensis]